MEHVALLGSQGAPLRVYFGGFKGFRVLGFKVLGFRVLGFKVLGFWVLGFALSWVSLLPLITPDYP